MHVRSQILHTGVWLGLAGAAIALAASAKSQPTWRPAVLELMDHRVLMGEVRDQGDSFLMKRRAGTLRIPKNSVYRVCVSLDELYALKRDEIEKRDPDEHVRLAQWCRRYELLDQAKLELAAALKLEPDHRQARIMYDSMVHLSKPRRRTKPRARRDSPTTQSQSALRLTKYRQWVALQSRGTLERFAGRVQMILVNHCGAAACHGSRRKGPLRLYRPSSGVPRSRGTTQKNLRAVFRCIRIEMPEASPLLVKPLLPQGGDPPTHAGGRVFVSTEDKPYQIMKKWVLSIQSSSKPSSGRRNKGARESRSRKKRR